MRGGDLIVSFCLARGELGATKDVEAAEIVVARALSLPESLVDDCAGAPGSLYGSNGLNESEARPSLLVSSDALGLVYRAESAPMEGSFFLKLLLPGDPLPAEDVVELLLLCTSESGCLLGEKCDMRV